MTSPRAAEACASFMSFSADWRYEVSLLLGLDRVKGFMRLSVEPRSFVAG